ncbi:hypothetical protein, partial [Xanthomonas arboricola]|uniref:hypothetical protein n=1 Tax=Xanthomonas arboricola TaxID=56448 RepID=UPI003D18B082
RLAGRAVLDRVHVQRAAQRHVQQGAAAILGERLPDYSLALWHGWNWPLAMSIAGMVGGTLLYMALRRTLDMYAIQNRSPGKA